MAYATFTQSYGTSNANATVKIINSSSGVPAIILASTSGGVLNDQGLATLDSSGNLSVIIDTAQTWTIFVNDQTRPQMQPLYVQTDPDTGLQTAVTGKGVATQVVSLSDSGLGKLTGLLTRDRTPISTRALTPIICALDFTQSCTLAVAGDSTGNGSDEWVYGLSQWLASQQPSIRVEYRLWNTTNLNYDSTQVLQTGDLSSRVVFSDTFSSGSGEVYGRIPDTGVAWSYDGSSALGDWTVSSGKLVRTSDTTTSTILAPYGIQGDAKFTLTNLNFSTVGDGVATQIFTVYLHYIDGSNSLYCDIRVSSAGAVTSNVFKRVAGTTTNIGSVTSPALIPGSTSNVTINFEVERVGTAVTTRVNGTTLVSATALTSGDVTVFNAGQKCGFVGGSGNLTSMSIDSVAVTVTPTVDTVPKISIYNGSAPGQTLAYQTTNFATMFPVAPDVMYVSSIHNYTTTTGSAYYTTLKTFCETTVKGTYPSCRIVVCSQNPKKQPAIGAESHLAKISQTRILASDMGYAYMPVAEGFLSTSGWSSLVQSDGVHPTVGLSGGTGSSLWRDIAVNQILYSRML